MKKSWSILAVIVAVLIFIVLLLISPYNSLVNQREMVRGQINTLQSQYQRRADLVPNLVNVVKGSSSFEQDTLTNVVEARSKATSVTLDPSNISSDKLQQYQSAQGELTSALSRLLVVVESYPDIKSVAAYQDLMTQLEGTENRIQVARSDYGKAVQTYNANIQRFPVNITAGLFGFDAFPYFTSDDDAATAPTVDFDTAE